MEIGLFQLENLILTGSRFQFLLLKEGPLTFTPEVEKLATRAEHIAPGEALAFLEDKKQEKTYPVILLGADTKMIEAKAAELEAAGYGNVYWVGL